MSVEERGSRLVAKVKWAGEDKTVEFERDSSGWRVDPFPELRALLR